MLCALYIYRWCAVLIRQVYLFLSVLYTNAVEFWCLEFCLNIGILNEHIDSRYSFNFKYTVQYFLFSVVFRYYLVIDTISVFKYESPHIFIKFLVEIWTRCNKPLASLSTIYFPKPFQFCCFVKWYVDEQNIFDNLYWSC